LKNKNLAAAAILLLLLASGCAMASSFGDVRRELPEQLGYMLYEEAIAAYGQPSGTSRQGDKLIAEWVRKGAIITERLQLTFDERQIMRAYDYSETPFAD
jgi:hypothetical protein